MITNYDLEKMAKSYNIELTGVYMKDQLDKLPINDGNYIINLHNLQGLQVLGRGEKGFKI